MHDDSLGKNLNHEFINTIPVIVPIFDGVKALSKSMKEWISCNFPSLLNELEDGPSESGKVDVRVSCSKWWYYCEDTLPDKHDVLYEQSPIHTSFQEESQERQVVESLLQEKEPTEVEEDNNKFLYFYMCPIVKRSNHRKHNSHQWFFDSICHGLEEKVSFAFLTDCGTSYDPTCVSRLLYDLYSRPDLIGSTARQRVETPNNFFHPCETTPFWCFQNDHTDKDQKPCWKCWAAYLLSPCPLQGFEFEATLILNSAMFNLVEALPVMPGPCQLLNWQKMKQYKVVDEYFNLLIKGETQRTLPLILPKTLRQMQTTTISRGTEYIAHPSNPSNLNTTAVSYGEITFTEFLRVNMRLAEDRILSFVSVFSTGYGTKWALGATFFYQPEVTWQSLLTQRRRWINGTFASLLFFFMSQRARTRIYGGLFDPHKAGKNIRFINVLWSLQLFQLALVLIAPAVFCAAGYVGLVESGNKWVYGFGWSHKIVIYHFTVAEIWSTVFLTIYTIWTFLSFYAKGGKMSEWLCILLSLLGFVYMFPVYFAVWYSIIINGLDLVGGLVICSLLVPVFIAIAESLTCALLYLLYLPWFMILIIFFLVFIPSYSFARLWDTTWGNRTTGKDSAIDDSVEQTMKYRNFVFSLGLIILNIFLSWAFVQLFMLGYKVVIVFMFIVFCPVIVQMICSFVFLFLVMPLRYFSIRPTNDTHVSHGTYGTYGGTYGIHSQLEAGNVLEIIPLADGRVVLHSPRYHFNPTNSTNSTTNTNTNTNNTVFFGNDDHIKINA